MIYSTINEAEQLAIDLMTLKYPGTAPLPIRRPQEQGREYFTLFAGDMVVRAARYGVIRAGMNNEIAEMIRLRSGGVPGVAIPRVVEADTDKGYMVIERLPGEALTPAILASLPPYEQDRIAALLGAFLAKMHSGQAKNRNVMRTDKWYSRSGELDVLHRAMAGTDDEATLTRLFALRSYVAKNDGLPDSFVTTHGDLWPGNILYDRGLKTLGVIDFACARSNYAHTEFTRLSFFYPTGFVEAAAESYQKLSGRPVRMDMVHMARDLRQACAQAPKDGAPFHLRFNS